MRVKEYMRVNALVELLEQRGVACDDRTERILMREGYYAVVNGYGKPFLDVAASNRADEDRYVAGTTFDQIYALFRFDRELRLLTFGELTRVEGMLRSVASTAFLDAHPEPDAYLSERSYTSERDYLLNKRDWERNLRGLLRTLSRYASDHDNEVRSADTRVAYYQQNYDAVPLWVVFTDFSYGNLFHFVALLKKGEQETMCRRLAMALSDGQEREPMSRQALVSDLDFLVDVRNLCAHGERLYDAVRYDNFVRMMGRFLTSDDYAAYRAGLRELVRRYRGISPVIDRALNRMHLEKLIGR